jgi:glutaredoxin 3
MAKKFLSQNNIHFEERNVSIDYAAAEELQKRNIQGVPSFFIGDDVVVGLDKAKLLALVDHRLAKCPKCGQKMRVPVNKGKIEVTCPKCAEKFGVNT